MMQAGRDNYTDAGFLYDLVPSTTLPVMSPTMTPAVVRPDLSLALIITVGVIGAAVILLLVVLIIIAG